VSPVGAAALGALAALWLGSAGPLPPSQLAVRTARGWETWWSADRAPAEWRAPDPAMSRARAVAGDERTGFVWRELELAGDGEAWRTRLVVAAFDPALHRLRLEGRLQGRRGAWRAADAGREAVLAVNAGQFSGYAPWGWLVHRGRELRAPGSGPLSAAVAVDTAGAVEWIEAGGVAARRARGGLVEAFQSYPVLLVDGRVPAALRAEGLGIDVAHRDARLAIGRRRDGWIVVALTRFDALGAAGGALPFGLTTPEMAAVMGALGCEEALALDGGISAQLRLRGADGTDRLWSGLRRVPLGLVVERR
jgi:uncharacterized protein YigE (DUF2233 family)